MSKKISRRDFLRFSAAAGMGLAVTGLVGCAPAVATTASASRTFLLFFISHQIYLFNLAQRLRLFLLPWLAKLLLD